MPVCFELHKTHPAIQPVWLHKIDHKDLMLQKVGIQYSPADLGLKHLDGSRMLECWWLYNRKITGWRTQDDVVLGECTQKGHPTVPASTCLNFKWLLLVAMDPVSLRFWVTWWSHFVQSLVVSWLGGSYFVPTLSVVPAICTWCGAKMGTFQN